MIIEETAAGVMILVSSIENDEVAGYLYRVGRETEIGGELWTEVTREEFGAAPGGDVGRRRFGMKFARGRREGGRGTGQTTLPFGKYKGRVLAAVPTDYLEYLLAWPKLRARTRESILAHLRTRGDFS